MTKLIHVDGYTPDIFGYTDEEWISYKKNFGPNYVLARLNRERGWDCSVHYFAREREQKLRTVNDLQYVFHPVSFPGLPATLKLAGELRMPFYRHQLQISLSFFRYLSTNYPDLVVFNVSSGVTTYIAAMLLRKDGIPYIAHLHGGSYGRSALRARFFNKAEAVIVTSETERTLIRENFSIPHEKIYCIPVGVDTVRFRPTIPIETRFDPTRLLFVGRIVSYKGIMDVLQCFRLAIEKTIDCYVDIVGPVGNQNHFRELQVFVATHNLGDRIKFHGALSSEALPDLYNKATLFVFPSRREGNPAVVMEAMACGTPVVSLETTPGANEVIISGKNGALTTVKNMPEVVTSLLQNKDEIKRLSAAARDRIEQSFSFESTYNKHCSLYQRILPEAKKGVVRSA